MPLTRLVNYGVTPAQNSNVLRFYNNSDVDAVPPYYPLLLPVSGVGDNPFDLGNGVVLDSPVLPASDSYVPPGLPFINGSQEVPPQSYGYGQSTHPMRLAIDPDSFPIWDGSPDNPPTLGDAFDYLAAGQSYFPPLGLNPDTSNWGAYAPASFSPLVPAWQALCWDLNDDGTQADDRVLAVPWSAPDFPFAGAQSIGFAGALSSSPVPISAPVTCMAPGLYQLVVTASVGIDTPGATVSLTIDYLPGPNAPSGAATQPSVWGTNSRGLPSINITDSGPYHDNDQVNWITMGTEGVNLFTTGFAFQGDVWTLSASASTSCNPTISGTFSFTRTGRGVSNATWAAGGGGGWWGPYWNGWWGGFWGYGWGWGWGWGGGAGGGQAGSWW